MRSFSKRTNWESAPNPLAEAFAEAKKCGKKILDLTISNPTHAGFNYLNQDLLKTFLNPKNLSYLPDSHGIPRAREAVCGYYAQKGVRISPEQIILTANTSEAYSSVFKLLTDPGDSIQAPSPSYPLLDYLAALSDIQLPRYPVILDKSWSNQFSNLPAGTKAVILVHPNNPTGNYVKLSEREKLSALAEEQNAALIVDEVFFDFDQSGTAGKAPTFAGYDKVLTFTLSGISKVLGLPQMKLSWIVVSGPARMRDEALRRLEIINDTYLSASAPAQNALPEWMKRHKTILEEISGRAAANLNQLKKIFPDQIPEVEGGWYAVILLPEHLTDETAAVKLLRQKEVFTHPGYLFDMERNCLVVSLLTEKSIFAEGIERIKIGLS